MQVYLILFVLAAVAALVDHSSNAVLEDPVASKAVMPGSVSGGAKAKSADCSSDASLEKAVDTRIPKKVTPCSASSVSKAKPARAKLFHGHGCCRDCVRCQHYCVIISCSFHYERIA